MDIQPLNHLLNTLGEGGTWATQRQLQRLIQQWPSLVGATVAQHSCPLEIHQGVLQVATSAAVWAQNLSYERRRILAKVNQQNRFASLGLKDIAFSTARWHSRPGSAGAPSLDRRLDSYREQLAWQQHPSRLPPPPEPPLPHAVPADSAPAGADSAFNQWSQRRRQQVQQVPPCPACGSPTPPGELQRWSVCAFCMAQHWHALGERDRPRPEAADSERKRPDQTAEMS